MQPSSLSPPHVVCPFDQSRTPREAGAHPSHQYELAGSKPAVGCRVRECERNRARRRVAEPIHIDHDLLVRYPELLRSVIDDADIGLVGYVHVDVLDGASTRFENLLGGVDHDTRGELENLAAVHLDVVVGIVERPRAAARVPEVLAAGPVRAELEAEEAARLDALEHDRAGTVAEEHERGAVVPVEDL